MQPQRATIRSTHSYRTIAKGQNLMNSIIYLVGLVVVVLFVLSLLGLR